MAYPTLPFFFFFFLLLITTLSSFPSLSSSCHSSERKALLSIKSTMGNPYIIITWDQPGETSNCCKWIGVECDSTSHVTSLDISGDTVAGTISPAIGDLPSLTSLTFRKLTNLTGPIPSTLAKLTKLTFLRLDWNDLSGPVPSFLSRLTSLDYLNLAFNHFTGSIPPSLSALPLLTFLRLDRNHLTGPIPDSLAKLPLEYLYLSHNNLTGPVPSSFSSSTRFQVIDLSHNKLTGDASFLLGRGGSSSLPLQRLDLSRNMFEFDLTKVGLPKDLVALDLNHNKVYGGIPKAFAPVPWQSFNVSYNRLCGEIPTSERFDSEYDFFHNKCLCGPPLPAPCTHVTDE